MTQPPPPPLSEALDAALTEPGTTTASSGTVEVEVDAADVDRIGVVIDAIRVRGGAGTVTERSERVASTVTPAGQPLLPVEVDERLGGGRLRSPVDAQRRYFEAEVTATEIEIRRQRLLDDNDRRPSELTVTRGQLGELIDQLEAAAAPLAE